MIMNEIFLYLFNIKMQSFKKLKKNYNYKKRCQLQKF